MLLHKRIEPKENIDKAFRDSYKKKLQKKELHVAFIDVNAMKYINDIYGHLVGDDALEIMAECITKCVRKEDRIIRFGGDEFVIFIPNLSEARVRKLTESIQNILKTNKILRKKVGGMSVSVGIVRYDEIKHKDLTGVLEAADILMYKAKSNPPDFLLMDKDVEIIPEEENRKKCEQGMRRRSYFTWVAGIIIKEHPTLDKSLLMSIARDVWNLEESKILDITSPNEMIKSILSRYKYKSKGDTT